MATNWQIGDRIKNRWEIHKILRGGMGIVYEEAHRSGLPQAAEFVARSWNRSSA